MTESEAPETSTKTKSRRFLTLAVEITALIATVVGLLIWAGVLPEGLGGKPEAAGAPDTTPGNTSSTKGAPPATAAGKPWVLLELATVPIVTGSIVLPRPAAIEADARFAQSVVMKCPNNVSAKVAEVTFELKRQYTEFKAHIWGYQQPLPADGAFDAIVTTRPPDNPSVTDPNPEAVLRERLTMGSGKEVTANIANAYKLSLEIACREPGGYVVFAGAAVR